MSHEQGKYTLQEQEKLVQVAEGLGIVSTVWGAGGTALFLANEKPLLAIASVAITGLMTAATAGFEKERRRLSRINNNNKIDPLNS